MNVTIPDALHICPGCEAEIVEQGRGMCGPCRLREAAKQGYPMQADGAARANALFRKLPRETGKMPEERYSKRTEFFFRIVRRMAKAVAAAAVVFEICWFLIH